MKHRIKATKDRLIKSIGNLTSRSYKDSMIVHNAMQHIADSFCECALACHVSGGMWFSKTSDGMEWSVRFEQMGVRDPKTGKIP